MLLRLGNGFAEFVSLLGGQGGSEGIKMGLDGGEPVDMVGDGILGGVIGSNGHAIGGRFSSIEFKGLDDVSIEIIGDASDVFEFIGHSAE